MAGIFGRWCRRGEQRFSVSCGTFFYKLGIFFKVLFLGYFSINLVCSNGGLPRCQKQVEPTLHGRMWKPTICPDLSCDPIWGYYDFCPLVSLPLPSVQVGDPALFLSHWLLGTWLEMWLSSVAFHLSRRWFFQIDRISPPTTTHHSDAPEGIFCLVSTPFSGLSVPERDFDVPQDCWLNGMFQDWGTMRTAPGWLGDGVKGRKLGMCTFLIFYQLFVSVFFLCFFSLWKGWHILFFE